jgi:hypothetical protein
MERSWYDDKFDKETATLKVSPEEMEIRDIAEDLAHKKSLAITNLIEFLVWVILLTFCWFYLQTHPAEKVSLFSGIEMMRNKVQMRFSSVPEEDKTILRQKESLEKTMQEIVLLSKESTCLDKTTKSNIDASFVRLQKMDLESYKKQSKAYNTIVWLYYNKVKEGCVE